MTTKRVRSRRGNEKFVELRSWKCSVAIKLIDNKKSRFYERYGIIHKRYLYVLMQILSLIKSLNNPLNLIYGIWINFELCFKFPFTHHSAHCYSKLVAGFKTNHWFWTFCLRSQHASIQDLSWFYYFSKEIYKGSTVLIHEIKTGIYLQNLLRSMPASTAELNFLLQIYFLTTISLFLF